MPMICCSSSKSHPIADTGYTLFELLIVALVTVIALRPEWHHTDAEELKSAALTLASDLRRTRSWAITHNAAAVVHVDVDQQSFRRSGAQTARDLPRGVAMQVALQDDVQPHTSGAVDLRFWPDGTAVGADLVLTLHGQHQQVTLDWLTGHVAVSP